MGMCRQSDQRCGMKLLREHLNKALAREWSRRANALSGVTGPRSMNGTPWRLQKQAYDRVMRPEERRRGAFMGNCDYIRLNPVRGGIVDRPEEWPYVGGLVPGFPELHPEDPRSWEIFWREYGKQREAEAPPSAGPTPLFDGRGSPLLP
jgi:hypothetical protein